MRLLLGLFALIVLTVLALRWLPVPTTAFMLQSPVTPVRYTWVPASRIADSMRAAVIAAEDQKFFEHRGFDFEAIEKAIDHNRQRRQRRGASTISQQTAKNLFLWPGGGYFRKGLEAGLTVLIETLWPKERILEVYLNIAEFGPGIYGVEAAAQTFFGKPASRLTALESARLAAVLPSPRRWSARQPGPYVQARSAWILRQMGYGPRHDPEPEPPAEPDQNDESGTAAPLTTDTPPAAPEDAGMMETDPAHERAVPARDPTRDADPQPLAAETASTAEQPADRPTTDNPPP
ncbi:monofunctional biosynthetic peptidoglycan transglycosylase [Fontimonas thermophila]|uniref:monofunctional biosynthetic peptidoglycan transglycosylase n=1 Tax=Fontimonas thermophila TaxID=1076937 RepID=UPI001F31D7EF|nr:monofunctional biosynthetic peptidoglycan transglycosylase [Fontimonas thermophila]